MRLFGTWTLHRRWKHHLSRGWVFFGTVIVVMAIVFSVFRALTPWARQYKPIVEEQISAILGQPVTIDSMETDWYWLQPVLRLNDVSLTDKKAHTLKLDKLLIGINLFSSLWHWKVQPGILYIDQTHLVFRQNNHHWTLDGFTGNDKAVDVGPETYQAIFAGLSLQEKIIVRHVSTVIHMQDGSIIPFNYVNMTIQNRGGRYRLKGTAQLDRATKTEFSVFADLQLNPLQWDKTKGQIYFSARSLLPAEWQRLLPKLPGQVLGGKGDVTLWMDVYRGQLSEGQGLIAFRHLKIHREGTVKPFSIDTVGVNLGWRRAKNGWRLSGDRLQLSMNNTTWPENAFTLNYDESTQAYRVFVKHLLIKPLLAMGIPWPEAIKPVLAMKPDGQLYDSEFDLKNQSLDYVLTGFKDLGWQAANKIPGVSGLSGVLYWQPHEGRLELDSRQTVIEAHQLPTLRFSHINTAVEWKPVNKSTRVTLDHLLLQTPDLMLTMKGVMDEPESYPKTHLHLETKFVASQAQRWIKYIPATVLKPKLYAWLADDIKQIGKASGQMIVDGNLADFPFDKSPGQFSIATQLNGVDLIIAPHWPLSRDIDAFLSVDKRHLNVDIQHADLSDIVVNQMNLRIDDIGLDYETLLLHGKINVVAEKLMAYVFSTPIGTHLARIKPLDLRGLLGLDIHIEVPLYPENDEVLTQGELQFNHNQATVHFGSMGLVLDALTGLVSFNQKGVLDSKLTGMMTGFPVTMHMQPIQVPQPALRVTLRGDATVSALQRMLHAPILSLMKGPLNLNAVLTLTESATALDNLKIQSSLKQVRVALPKPLGKAAGTPAPLTVNIDFDAQKSLRLRANYAARLSADLAYILSEKNIALDKGEIYIGSEKAQLPKEKGLRVAGDLAAFDHKQWLAALSKVPFDKNSPSFLDSVHWVDVHVGKLAFFHHQVTDIGLKATQLNNHDWSLQIAQKDLTADIRYQPKTNSISGDVQRIQITPSAPNAAKPLTATSEPALSPEDIPNLHLTVQHLIYGDVDTGAVFIDSTSSKTALKIDSLKLSTPSYELQMKGNWVKDKAVNRTDVNVELTTSSLGKSFERWQLKPLMEANKGSLYFEGGWPGSFTDFSLGKVSGQMQITLKGGRITDLGSATEEKIGFGKLLSIFSLQTIPRRLKLDFSDLSKNGYSFDEFKGDFVLKQGVMNTQNSAMDGPVAYVSMKGDVDFVKHLFFLDMNVSPHVMASLPLVVGIVGAPVSGPIAFLATWAASKIINQGLQKVTGYTYKVTGPWSDPKVEQTSIDKRHVK